MKRVFLDPGHGGKDSGALGNNLTEGDINLDVTLKVGAILARNRVSVSYSRKSDIFIELENRCKLANALKADLFVSVHHNAGGGTGAECIFSVNHGVSEVLANNIMAEFIAIGQKKRSTYDRANNKGKDYFAVIRDSQMPAVIIEYCFIDSVDFKRIDEAVDRTVEATAIAKGILKTLGVPYKG